MKSSQENITKEYEIRSRRQRLNAFFWNRADNLSMKKAREGNGSEEIDSILAVYAILCNYVNNQPLPRRKSMAVKASPSIFFRSEVEFTLYPSRDSPNLTKTL